MGWIRQEERENGKGRWIKRNTEEGGKERKREEQNRDTKKHPSPRITNHDHRSTTYGDVMRGRKAKKNRKGHEILVEIRKKGTTNAAQRDQATRVESIRYHLHLLPPVGFFRILGCGTYS